METVQPTTKKILPAGNSISVLCILFLLMDGGMKVFKAKPSIYGSALLGWPLSAVTSIGIALLICTLFYPAPRTAVLGEVPFTAFLGGATTIMVRAGQPFYLPIIFGVFGWAGLFLRNRQLRMLFPLNKEA